MCRRHRAYVEPLDGVAARRGRHTNRLADLHRYIAFALGGSAGARMAERICCPVSADTLSRRIISFASNQAGHPPPRVLGVDDWAWRRGRRYGTILVDLERNKAVDLLPDRQSETLAYCPSSTGRRNSHVRQPQVLVKRLGRCLPAKGLARPGVERQRYCLESILAVST